MTAGALHGVGVGPGDPELITLKAYRLISGAETLAYIAADASDGPRDSRARRTVEDAIPEDAVEIEIRTPMRVEPGAAGAAYDAGAAKIAERLEAGRDVVFLCEGDPLFYGSFIYIAARLGTRFRVETTPGVASPMAAAAALGRPLVARAERFVVLPCTADLDSIAANLAAVDSAALMKVGRRLPEIRALLERLDLIDRAYFVSEASTPAEIALPLRDAPQSAPYFSMILILSKEPSAYGV